MTRAPPRLIGIPLFVLLTFFPTAGRAAEFLSLVTEDAPPLSMVGPGDRVGGNSTDRITSALDKAGIGYSIALYPWARAESMALSNPDTCVYSTARTPEREAHFKWIGPIGLSFWTLFGRVAGPRPKSLDEVGKGLIGGYVGDSATKYLEERGLRVTKAREGCLNLKKLRAGRIDYWVDGLQSGLYRIRRSAITDVAPVLQFKSAPLYLACNSGVSDHIVAQLNRLLWQIEDDGELPVAPQP